MAPADHDAIIRKVLLRLVPFCILCYLLNYLDRVNISIAKLAIRQDVPDFTDEVYSQGAAIFFVGYCIFELPSNLIQERVGPRRWIARIMISWGLVAMAFIFLAGPKSFYTLRFLLGLAEAGFFPGVVLYLSQWVPHHYRARTSALFLTATALSGALGNALGGYILYLAEKYPTHLHPWQWLFLLEGLPTVLLGLFTIFYLTDKPAQARWLKPEERETLTNLLAEEARAHPQHHLGDLKYAFQSVHTWVLSLIYALIIFAFYTVNYFTPTIVKNALLAAGSLTTETPKHLEYLRVGLLSAIPFGAAAIGMVLIARHSDKRNERKLHLVGACLCSGAGLFLAGYATGIPDSTGTALTIIGLALGAIGAFGIFGPFWALPSQLLSGTAAVAAFAIINSIGNLLGGYGATICYGKLAPRNNLWLAAAMAVAAAVVTFLAPIPRPATIAGPATAK